MNVFLTASPFLLIGQLIYSASFPNCKCFLLEHSLEWPVYASLPSTFPVSELEVLHPRAPPQSWVNQDDRAPYFLRSVGLLHRSAVCAHCDLGTAERELFRHQQACSSLVRHPWALCLLFSSLFSTQQTYATCSDVLWPSVSLSVMLTSSSCWNPPPPNLTSLIPQLANCSKEPGNKYFRGHPLSVTQLCRSNTKVAIDNA